MNWFLVLLFWNPAAQDYQIANGWAPMPMASYERCEERMDYVQRYLPDYTAGAKNVVDCILATDQHAATTKMKDML